jgi:hypothetical protein
VSRNVYQIGGSADGNAALAGGVNEMPPQLKAQFIIWATGSGHQSSFQNGAWTQELLERWLEGSGFPETIDQVKAQEVYSDWWDTVEINNKYGRCVGSPRSPSCTYMARACRTTAEAWRGEGAPRCYFPSVFWAGWYDIFLK